MAVVAVLKPGTVAPVDEHDDADQQEGDAQPRRKIGPDGPARRAAQPVELPLHAFRESPWHRRPSWGQLPTRVDGTPILAKLDLGLVGQIGVLVSSRAVRLDTGGSMIVKKKK